MAHDEDTRDADLFGLLIIGRPEWQRDALCAEYPLEWWFPDRGATTADAKAVCARCVVRNECRAFALEAPDALAGVWGGTSQRERRLHRRTAA